MSSDFPLVGKVRVDPRTNNEYNPSKVLFVRGLPSNLQESDIIEFCSHVGVVESVFYLKSKGQAFIEFDSEEAADECLKFFYKHPPKFGNNKLHFSYSGRNQIESKPPEDPAPNKILLLNITSCKYPINPQTLQQIFERFGKLLRCIIIERSFGFQAFVELDSLQAAMVAKTEIDGVNIFPDSNLLRIRYSLLKRLKIEYPGTNAKDFEAENPAFIAEKMLQRVKEVNKKNTVNQQASSQEDEELKQSEIKVLFLHNLSEKANPDYLFNLFSMYGNVVRIKIFFTKRDMGLLEYTKPEEAQNAKKYLDNMPFLGKTLLVSFSRNNFMNMPTNEERRKFCKEYIDSPFQRFSRPGSKNFNHVVPPSIILHLSNLPDKVDANYFKEQFRPHGTVIGYKPLQSDRRMALIKMESLEQSVAVLVFHHNKVISGRQVSHIQTSQNQLFKICLLRFLNFQIFCLLKQIYAHQSLLSFKITQSKKTKQVKSDLNT